MSCEKACDCKTSGTHMLLNGEPTQNPNILRTWPGDMAHAMERSSCCKVNMGPK